MSEMDVARFISSLPDPNGAAIFAERLAERYPERRMSLLASPRSLSRLLTLASYSPFLGQCILAEPELLDWIERDIGADLGRPATPTEIAERLARYLLASRQGTLSARLGRFKLRELSRIYLRDCLRIATLSEVTDELSRLADAILREGLAEAETFLARRFGHPQTVDERGLKARAGFAVLALGKLGCRELNFWSDVDLMFLYRGHGSTVPSASQVGSPAAPDAPGTAAAINNKEFFILLAERLLKTIAGTANNAASGQVYRVDLRLRPHGRDGEIVSELASAVEYYRKTAQHWERQALIRARWVAGDESLAALFLEQVHNCIFNRESSSDAYAELKKLRHGLERRARSQPGFNVKLGLGGIREIEFIVQALQIAHGGEEPWLRPAQMLIVLARLAEKGFLSRSDHARLAAAYTFLRTVEHRLQMEEGTQTHSLPVDDSRLLLVARRCGHRQGDPSKSFLDDLAHHTSAVRAIYERVMARESRAAQVDDRTRRDASHYWEDKCAMRLARLIRDGGEPRIPAEELTGLIRSALRQSVNPGRAARNLDAWLESLSTVVGGGTLPGFLRAGVLKQSISRIARLLASPYFAAMVAARPLLAAAVASASDSSSSHDPGDFYRELTFAMHRGADPGSSAASENTGASKESALRRAWHRPLLEIGWRDLAAIPPSGAGDRSSEIGNQLDQLRENNLAQTALAEAVMRIAACVAIEDAARSVREYADVPFSIFGLGRLGHAGMDYGSDLDLLVVYNDSPSPAPAQERFARITARIVKLLSGITRDGFLYNVDLRLRPEGQSGCPATSLHTLLAYLSERASPWEHSAYLKIREVAGDLEFGACARHAVIEAIFQHSAIEPALGQELKAMRHRLEREKARGNPRDIKWGPGGLTDVYFITRYLQLRDKVYVEPQLGTRALVLELARLGLLGSDAAAILADGYAFLRRLDHWLRVFLERRSTVLPVSGPVLADAARAMGISSEAELDQQYRATTNAIRAEFERIFG